MLAAHSWRGLEGGVWYVGGITPSGHKIVVASGVHGEGGLRLDHLFDLDHLACKDAGVE